MRHARPSLLAAALLLAVGASFAPSARAQDAGGNLKTSENLSVEDVAKLEAWTTRQMNQLRSGLPEDVATARDLLIKELRTPGASNAYKSALSRVVLSMGADMIRSDKLLVRTNTAIVLAYINSLDGVAVLAQGVGDGAAGMRYKCCQSIRLLIEPTPAERRNIGSEREGVLIKALAARIIKEPDANVYREMVNVLAMVGSPATQEALLNALDARLANHVANTEESFETEVIAINALYQKFIQTDEKGPLLIRLLATAYLHEKLAAAQMTGDGALAKRIGADRKALVQACDKLIRAQYIRLNPGVQMPPDTTPLLTLGNRWKEVKQVVEQWKDLLKAAPVSIPEAKLK